jgi:hypothetical protein
MPTHEPSDEYRELLEEARDALRALLRGSEPGTGRHVQTAYNEIRKSLGETRCAEIDDWNERRAEWGRIPRADRDYLALDLLGEERLTIAELTERFIAELPDCKVYDSDVRRVVRRLYEAGDLDREGERWRKGDSIRYRYFRPGLSGPIADLDRAFQE